MIYHCDHADEEALDGLEAEGEAEGGKDPEADASRSAALAELRRVHEDDCRTCAEVRRRGIPVVIGGDHGFAVNPQGTDARDLQHFVEQYGFTPAEALHAGTAVGARAMCREHELGRIRPGFLADLLLVDGDPLEDVRLLQDRERLLPIVKGGAVHADRTARTGRDAGRDAGRGAGR